MLNAIMMRSSGLNINVPPLLNGLPVGSDAEQRKRLDQLAKAVAWANGKPLYVGEFGVPVNDSDPASQASQLALHDMFLTALDYYGVHGTGWSSGAWLGGTNFDASKNGSTAYFYNGKAGERINTKSPIAQQIVNHVAPGVARGTNLSGLDWGGGRGAQVNGFIPNTTECNYMGSEGLNIVRLTGNWEAYYPTLDGPLDQTAVNRLFSLIKRCGTAGISVILDCNHTAMRYTKADGTVLTMKPTKGELTSHHLSDFWVKMSAAIKADPLVDQTVVAIDLVNEPNSLPPQTPTATPSTTPRNIYEFEDGTVQGWNAQISTSIRYNNNAAEAYRADWSAPGKNYFRMAAPTPRTLLPEPDYEGDVKVTARIASPASGGVGAAQLVVYDSSGAAISGSKITLTSSGKDITVTLPAARIAPPNQIQILVDSISTSAIADNDAYKLTNISVIGITQPDPSEKSYGGAQIVEYCTQDAVTELRAAGESRTICVPTYQFSQMHKVQQYHPNGPWITDPANNIWYEVHSYWDRVGNGIYSENGTCEPYSTALQIAIDQGY